MATSDLESDENLHRRAKRGVVIAVVPGRSEATKQEEHCVEASLDANGHLHRRILCASLDGRTLPNVTQFSSVSHAQITERFNGRFVGRFKYMSDGEIRRYLHQHQNERIVTPRTRRLWLAATTSNAEEIHEENSTNAQTNTQVEASMDASPAWNPVNHSNHVDRHSQAASINPDIWKTYGYVCVCNSDLNSLRHANIYIGNLKDKTASVSGFRPYDELVQRRDATWLPVPQDTLHAKSEPDRVAYCPRCLLSPDRSPEIKISRLSFGDHDIRIYPFKHNEETLFCILSKGKAFSNAGHYQFWLAHGGYSPNFALVTGRRPTVQSETIVLSGASSTEVTVPPADRSSSSAARSDTSARNPKRLADADELLRSFKYPRVSASGTHRQHDSSDSVVNDSQNDSVLLGTSAVHQGPATPNVVTESPEPRPSPPATDRSSSSTAIRTTARQTAESVRDNEDVIEIRGRTNTAASDCTDDAVTGTQASPGTVEPKLEISLHDATNIGLSESQIQRTDIGLQVEGDQGVTWMSLEGCNSPESFFRKVADELALSTHVLLRSLLVSFDGFAPTRTPILPIRMRQGNKRSFEVMLATIVGAQCWKEGSTGRCEVMVMVDLAS